MTSDYETYYRVSVIALGLLDGHLHITHDRCTGFNIDTRCTTTCKSGHIVHFGFKKTPASTNPLTLLSTCFSTLSKVYYF